MAGLVPAIHVLHLAAAIKNVDARHKAGHDGNRYPAAAFTEIGATSCSLSASFRGSPANPRIASAIVARVR